MANAAIIATALTNRAARSKGLYLDGLDVTRNPVGIGNTYGVDIRTVEVEEAGPGGVSSMLFTIDDPNVQILLTDSMGVRFHDITNDIPIFTGWVQDWDYLPDFGHQGRSIIVNCIGIEAALDWSVTSVDLSFTAITLLSTIVQGIIGVCVGPTQLRAGADASALSGSQANPIGLLNGVTNVDAAGAAVTITIAAGTSMRTAITTALGLCVPAYLGVSGFNVTVDGYRGVRVWPKQLNVQPLDWANVAFPGAGPINYPENHQHSTDAAGIVRAVYVTGGNVAGSGLVSDGTGKMGPIAQISDSTSLSVSQRDAIGLAYLGQFALGFRGEFDLQDWTPYLTMHPGSWMQLTAANLGLSSTYMETVSIRKTFNAVRQNWHINYGGFAPSAASLTRRLTRSTRS